MRVSGEHFQARLTARYHPALRKQAEEPTLTPATWPDHVTLKIVYPYDSNRIDHIKS